MRTEEYQRVCQAVASGEEKQVKHIVTHKVGRILACHEGEFDVDCGGENRTWIKENCVEEK